MTIGPSLLGLPAIVTDHQPAIGQHGDVILADLRHFLIGDRLIDDRGAVAGVRRVHLRRV